MGGPFRAAEHEAVAETAASAQHPEGSVVEVVQQGYAFTGGLLRPAKVVVARRPASASSAAKAASPPEEPGAGPSG